MENKPYPPMTIDIDVYYFEDEETGVINFDEEEMLSEFERKLKELKNKFGSSEK